MMRILKSFLKERRSLAIMIVGAGVIFAGIFVLFEVPVAVAGYAFLLVVLWVCAIAVWDFVKYLRHQKKLEEQTERILTELDGLPEAGSILEEQYQEIVRRLYREKDELEFAIRTRERESADYYSMWVHQIKTPIAALRVLLQNAETQRQEMQRQEMQRQETQRQESQNVEADSRVAPQTVEREAFEEEYDFRTIRSMKMELFKIEQYVGMILTYLRMDDMSADFSFGECSLDQIVRQSTNIPRCLC